MKTTTQEEFPWLDRASDFLDTRYRIPGTNIRFGADFIIGLVPYAGDLVSFLLSGGLVVVMARKGASGSVVARMILNVAVDAIVGSVPILGDLFDLGFKANRRNLRLLKEHYEEGKHQGSGRGIVVGVIVALIVIFVLAVVLLWWIVAEALAILAGLF